MGEERDSLSPHVEGALKSRRLRAFLFGKVLPWAVVAAIYPSLKWIETRYDTESARKLTERTQKVERLVGVGDPIGSNEKSLRDRMKAAEKTITLAHQEQLLHDHDMYRHYVSLAAASAEGTRALRAQTAGDKVSEYEKTCQCWGEVIDPEEAPAKMTQPYHCQVEPSKAAAIVLETKIPR